CRASARFRRRPRAILRQVGGYETRLARTGPRRHSERTRTRIPFRGGARPARLAECRSQIEFVGYNLDLSPRRRSARGGEHERKARASERGRGKTVHGTGLSRCLWLTKVKRAWLTVPCPQPAIGFQPGP